MRAQNSAVILSACAALACGTSTELPNTRPAQQPVEERVQPIQEAAPAPQLPAAPPAAPSPTASEQVEVDGALLTLEGCQLTVESSGTITKHALPLPDGCTFGRRKADGPVQVEPTDRGLTVLVVSSKRVAVNECDTHIRGVVVGKKGVSLSSEEQFIARCGANGPFSDMMFVALAHTVQPLP